MDTNIFEEQITYLKIKYKAAILYVTHCPVYRPLFKTLLHNVWNQAIGKVQDSREQGKTFFYPGLVESS